ncbi:hypothetical protein AA3271_0252 [Gluconobacter japonicus NBRC 3271]|nr:hypothetical protein AA3271_0252 [Gluconobacter japonicus NBRC 3271]
MFVLGRVLICRKSHFLQNVPAFLGLRQSGCRKLLKGLNGPRLWRVWRRVSGTNFCLCREETRPCLFLSPPGLVG